MKKYVKVGEFVKWECSPFGQPSFIAEGVVREIGKSTFGSKRKGIAVKIEPLGKYRERYPKRKTTTIASYNLFRNVKQS